MIFRNRIAMAVWGFAVVSLLFVGTMTYVLIREGAPQGSPPALVAVITIAFWLGGLGLAAYAATRPTVRVSVEAGGSLTITWQYPFRKATRSVALAEVTDVAVVEGRDDEDFPYFYARMTLRDGNHVNLMESHDRARCETVRALFNSAVS